VVVREGDPVDLTGNGLNDDDAFIANYQANDLFLSDGRTVYFFAALRNGSGARLADAFGSQLGNADYNPDADLDGSGGVNVTDFSLFATVFGVPCP
jgi:hypothetical protein